VKKNIPNFITLLNLTSGLIALYFIFQQNWNLSALFVALGIFFDYLDGFVARSLQAYSKVGLELDSLADMITSGVVPAFTMFFLIKESLIQHQISGKTVDLLPFAGLFIALGSAYRLAKFNVDERQTESFIGLPTPANAIFILSLPLIIFTQQIESINQIIFQPYFLIFLSLLSAYILNAEIPLFSLKFKNFTWRNNPEKYILIAVSLLLLIVLRYLAVPFIIIFYILLSIFYKKQSK
jgi:CDP-diacylglycerol--serine O-phosphatidyltransferase